MWDRPPQTGSPLLPNFLSGKMYSRPPSKPPLTQLPKPGFGTRLQQAKLSFRQIHLLTDLLLRLFQQIKARQNLPITLRNTVENRFGNLFMLLLNGGLFRIAVEVHNHGSGLQANLLPASMDGLIDVSSHLPSDHRSYKAHQPLGLAKFSPAYGLHHDQERIMDLIFKVLGSQLTAQVETNASGENFVEFLHAGLVLGLESLHQVHPMGACRWARSWRIGGRDSCFKWRAQSFSLKSRHKYLG